MTLGRGYFRQHIFRLSSLVIATASVTELSYLKDTYIDLTNVLHRPQTDTFSIICFAKQVFEKPITVIFLTFVLRLFTAHSSVPG